MSHGTDVRIVILMMKNLWTATKIKFQVQFISYAVNMMCLAMLFFYPLVISIFLFVKILQQVKTLTMMIPGSMPANPSSLSFREKLIEHFDMIFHQKKIVWSKLIKSNSASW